jgi:hypothetical protein
MGTSEQRFSPRTDEAVDGGNRFAILTIEAVRTHRPADLRNLRHQAAQRRSRRGMHTAASRDLQLLVELSVVMRGLDPCIDFFEMMDCRVKPGNDVSDEIWSATNENARNAERSGHGNKT